MREKTRNRQAPKPGSSEDIRAISGEEILTLPGRVTSTSVELPINLVYEEYLKIGLRLGMLKHFTKFAIGDWLVYGERTYGEKYTQAAAEIGLSIDETYQLHYVSSNVNFPCRNHSLFWSHHKEVAKLSPIDQVSWLNKAAEHRWPVHQLREALEQKGLRRPTAPRSAPAAAPAASLIHSETQGTEPAAANGAAEKEAPKAKIETENCAVCEEEIGTIKVCAACVKSIDLALAQIQNKLPRRKEQQKRG